MLANLLSQCLTPSKYLGRGSHSIIMTVGKNMEYLTRLWVVHQTEQEEEKKKKVRESSVGNIFSLPDKWFHVNHPRLVKQGGGEIGHIIHVAVH